MEILFPLTYSESLKKKRFYLFIHASVWVCVSHLKKRERNREAETQAEGEAGSIQGARWGTQFQDSGIMPWAKCRHSTAEPPRDPKAPIFTYENVGN